MHGPLHEPYAILSLSLGTTRNFEIRETRTQRPVSTVPLRHGDLVAMNGLFQSLYQHRYVHQLLQNQGYNETNNFLTEFQKCMVCGGRASTSLYATSSVIRKDERIARPL
jgi:hypothetical protein